MNSISARDLFPEDSITDEEKNCEQKPTASRDRTDPGLSRRHYNRCNLLSKIVPDFQKETRDG